MSGWDDVEDEEALVHDEDWDDSEGPDDSRWKRPQGIFVLVPITGEAGAQIQRYRERFDPRLAASNSPHVTLVGSSGVGPIDPQVDPARLREVFERIARETAPFSMAFGRAHRFMQTNVVSLELPPHGPLRELHERIVATGLPFQPARFTFTPHATINFFATVTRARERELLAARVTAPLLVEELELSLTDDPKPHRELLRVRLGGRESGVGSRE